MSERDQIRKLVSHDGLRDSLTGLMSYSSFMENAVRDFAAAQRFQRNFNLFLISLTELDSHGVPTLVIRSGRQVTDLNEEELYDLASRVLAIANSLGSELRTNDLVSRYAFADFLVMNFGDRKEITNKLSALAESHGAALLGVEMDASSGMSFLSSPEHFQENLRRALASLEREMVSLYDIND